MAKKSKKPKRQKLATIYKPDNKMIEPVLRKCYDLTQLKKKGVGFGAFILIAALRDANRVLEAAQRLEKEEADEQESGK